MTVKKNIEFFLDFDGTIVKSDTCSLMSKTFCREGWKEIEQKWERREITTEQCVRETLKLLSATKQALCQLLDTVEIDKYFGDFVLMCRKNNYPLYILSDGFDLNIEHILQKYELHPISVYANHLTVNEGTFTFAPGNFNPSCGQCGTCKTTLIQTLKDKKATSVYVGDGYSDICACRNTDVVFAKDNLLSYCRNNHISAIPFDNFNDIIQWIGRD